MNERMTDLLPVTEASFAVPDHLVLSAWTEHAPFAFWLVEAHRPRTIVELGTHNGLSYFSFCQAVERAGLATHCFAVDTWEGDEHAGFYSSEVHELVERVNRRYGGFSQLLRMTFDDAVGAFDDGSIDLLHIDGRHFVDDVLHDFETWRPKLSDRSIVLFHDTNEYGRDFGVHLAWAQIRERHPASVEFLHGHGLGVLQVGEHLDPDVAAWFATHENADAIETLRTCYARLGAGIRDRFDSEALARTVDELRSKLVAANDAIERRDAELEHVKTTRDRFQEAVEAERRRADRLEMEARELAGYRTGSLEREAIVKEQLRDAEERAEAAAKAAADAHRRGETASEELRRLRARRSVRFALAVAARLAPLLRLGRRRGPAT
jgi:O-antigen biosynthesis protein